jgi:D-alanyl-D-alanine dipeptidase
MSALWAAVFLTAAAAGPTYGPEHLPAVADAEDPLVDAAPVVPGLIVQLAYATPNNFTGKALYPPGARCWLRRSVAERLAQAAAILRERGLRLVAWDCTRPSSVQLELWKAHPHAGSVADPKRGSLHERGVAIDAGLADLDGKPVPLPTPFDFFGKRAHADAKLDDPRATENRDALNAAMNAAGFRVNPREWWHFSRLYGWRWPPAKMPGER